MFGAEALGNEPGERSADRLPARAAEHRFGRGVEHHDPLFFIDRDDGVHGRFDDARYTGFDVLQCALSGMALRDLAIDEPQRSSHHSSANGDITMLILFLVLFAVGAGRYFGVDGLLRSRFRLLRWL